jgi:hypothetical protein
VAGLSAVVTDPNSRFNVVVEDDGRVAYAYLREGRVIVADVWLYNSGPTPAHPEWRDRSKMPFANPRDYVADEDHPILRSPADVSAQWIVDGDRLRAIDIYLRGERYARLAPGAKPGWSKLAKRRGPLALPLTDAPTFMEP